MIEALIGLAIGAGGMWLLCARWRRIARDALDTADMWKAERDRVKAQRDHRTTKGLELLAAHSRCSDSQSVLHEKVQSIRTLCRNRKDSTAKAAMKILGEG